MKYFSLFAGIGGFECGIKRAATNWECVGYSEIDKYAIQTYRKHFPNHINFGDARKINTKDLPDFDLLCGGFPCQAFSIAGKRMGFEDTRGTLFFEIARIAKDKRPRFLLLENVKGLLSHDGGRTFATILATLDELGYNAEWECLNSKYFGVPQNRERVFIIGHLRGKPSQQIFPLGTGDEIHYGKPEQEKTEKGESQLVMIQDSGSEVARVYGIEGIAPTLKGKTGGWQEPKIVMVMDSDKKDCRVFGEEGITPSVQARSDTHKIVMNAITESIGSRQGSSSEFLASVEKINQATSKIRRLTPLECERLQGFPDGWTIEGLDEKGNIVKISETQRYRQLGNAVTVNVVQAIIEKFIKQMDDTNG